MNSFGATGSHGFQLPRWKIAKWKAYALPAVPPSLCQQVYTSVHGYDLLFASLEGGVSHGLQMRVPAARLRPANIDIDTQWHKTMKVL
jgi:hypothetical protein